MLEDPRLGPDMMEAMSDARHAATLPRAGLRDWYDGSTFRDAVAKGLFQSNTSVALSLATDGFEVWRQKGFQGWPVIATVLNLEPSTRSKNISQVLLTITPGPKQPVDLESFMRPIADELSSLSRGISGVRVAGSTELQTLTGFALQFTTDMPAGTKVSNTSGHNGRCPNRFRAFNGVLWGSHYYFPPVHPSSGVTLFSIAASGAARRPQTWLQDQAAVVEQAQRDKRSAQHIAEIAKQTGLKGPSLFFALGAQDRAKYASLEYLWRAGPDATPYDTMHLILENVVPFLWQLFSGELTLPGADAEPYAMKAADAVAVGRELVAAKTTVPTSRARALRDVHSRFRSYKAVDWMYFILSTCEVVLHNRIPADAFGMFMSLCAACRFLFRPNALSDADVSVIDSELKSFCFKYYSIIYRGSWGAHAAMPLHHCGASRHRPQPQSLRPSLGLLAVSNGAVYWHAP